MKIKALIVEDERIAREELAYLLQQEHDFILCPSAENGRQLLDFMDDYKPDVIFLDIHMPSLSGIDAARRIKSRSNHLPLFVFTTAYEEHAVQAFELEAVDYLLKPYDTIRFQEALNRVRKHLAFPPERPKQVATTKLLFEDKEKLVALDPQSIYYAVRENRFVNIHTAKGVLHSKMTLQELDEKLSEYPFFRPHRSYLVNLEWIGEVIPWFNGAYNLILTDEKRTMIPVSRSSAKTLFQLLR